MLMLLLQGCIFFCLLKYTKFKKKKAEHFSHPLIIINFILGNNMNQEGAKI